LAISTVNQILFDTSRQLIRILPGSFFGRCATPIVAPAERGSPSFPQNI